MNVLLALTPTSSFTRKVILPLLALALFTPWSAQLDLWTSDFFFQGGHFGTSALYDFVYQYGIFPAWLVVLVAIAALILKKWRKEALFLILTLAIGSGLIIHALLKDHWGRPRPRQVIEYGGQQQFHPYYIPHFGQRSEPSKSFPCGHCSMGFYFFAVALLAKHAKRKNLYYVAMCLAWGLGGLLGFVRIAQGGHFLSDVLVSALIMWLTAVGLYEFLILGKKDERLNT